MWRCRCDCGNERDAYSRNLVQGSTRSCGCLMRELASARGGNVIHGLTGSRTHNAWRASKERCANPKNKKYADYGGRGISMCDRWRSDFLNFLADMGVAPTPKSELDRIDNEKGYEPGNCRWATREDQMMNRRTTTLIADGDQRLTVKQFSERTGIPYQTVIWRIHKLGLHGTKDAPVAKILAAGR